MKIRNFETKSKIFLLAAGLAFVAAACNNTQTNSGNSGPIAAGDYRQDSVNSQAQQAPQTPSAGQTPDSTTPQAQENTIDGNNIQVVGVDITSTGFSPANIKINKGDYVQFKNLDSNLHWPISDSTPAENFYAGFDAKQGLATKKIYRLQFLKSGIFNYHDNLNPTLIGKIVVSP